MEAYACEVSRHEFVHADTARAVAEYALNRVSTIEAETPKELERLFDEVWQLALAWGNREDLRFDEFTGHGPRL